MEWLLSSFPAWPLALRLGAPGITGLGLAAVVGIVIWALWRGPLRLVLPESADAGLRGRHWRRPDFAFGLSVTLRGAAGLCLAVALGRPVGLVPENSAGGTGVDLVLALDASGSMRALDALLEGRRVTRLELAKRVVADFVAERRGDRIGLVVFGEKAFTQCPLTVDHRLVLESLARVEVGLAGDATALGEAIGLSTRRLSVPGAPAEGQRVIVVFTDGRHNSGRIAPETAARLARSRGVRIHAVGIGGEGVVPFAQETPGQPLRFEKVDLDQDTLRSLAEITGGGFFHARDPADLVDVLHAIDQLEARPLAAEPEVRSASLIPLALAWALALLLAETLTAHGLLRRVP